MSRFNIYRKSPFLSPGTKSLLKNWDNFGHFPLVWDFAGAVDFPANFSKGIALQLLHKILVIFLNSRAFFGEQKTAFWKGPVMRE